MNSYATVQRIVFLRAHDQGQIYKHQQPKNKQMNEYIKIVKQKKKMKEKGKEKEEEEAQSKLHTC